MFVTGSVSRRISVIPPKQLIGGRCWEVNVPLRDESVESPGAGGLIQRTGTNHPLSRPRYQASMWQRTLFTRRPHDGRSDPSDFPETDAPTVASSRIPCGCTLRCTWFVRSAWRGRPIKATYSGALLRAFVSPTSHAGVDAQEEVADSATSLSRCLICRGNVSGYPSGVRRRCSRLSSFLRFGVSLAKGSCSAAGWPLVPAS